MTADPSGTMPSGADPIPRSTRHWIHRWFVFLIVGFAGFISGSYSTEAFAAPVHAPDFKSGVRL
jgi:hypothetical protein